jgi:hypothetical protein
LRANRIFDIHKNRIIFAAPQRAGKLVGNVLAESICTLGIRVEENTCGCKAMIARMNHWQAKGCRENAAEIIEHLEKQFAKYLEPLTKWQRRKTRIKIGLACLRNGLPLSVEGILDHTIKQVEGKSE